MIDVKALCFKNTYYRKPVEMYVNITSIFFVYIKENVNRL